MQKMSQGKMIILLILFKFSKVSLLVTLEVIALEQDSDRTKNIEIYVP